MREDIKERIELIKCGMVPEGYKNTPIGIVPKNWKEIRFEDVFIEIKEKVADTDKFPLCSLTLEDGIIEKSERYDREHLLKKEESVYKVVHPGEFAYNPMNIRYGAVARNKTGRTVVVSGYYDVFRLKDSEETSFMENFLIGRQMIKYYNRVCTGSLEEKKRVHFSDFLRFYLPMPTSQERKKIAELLKLYDVQIDKLKALIVEKENEKRYYIQELFAGKLQVENIDSKWNEVLLRDLLVERKEKKGIQKIQICSVAVKKGIVNQKEHLGRSYAADDTSKYNVVMFGDIVYTKSPTGEYPYGIVKQSYVKEKVAVSPLYGVFKPKTFECGYILQSYFQNQKKLFNYLHPIIQKGAKNTINISNDTFLSRRIKFPVDKETQEMVKKILEFKDMEINRLERILEEKKKEKNGMMQILLSGIVQVNKV